MCGFDLLPLGRAGGSCRPAYHESKALSWLSMEKDITHRPSYQSINNCDSQRSKSPPGSTETVSVYSNQILLAISEFHTEISYCMIPPPGCFASFWPTWRYRGQPNQREGVWVSQWRGTNTGADKHRRDNQRHWLWATAGVSGAYSTYMEMVVNMDPCMLELELQCIYKNQTSPNSWLFLILQHPFQNNFLHGHCFAG